MNCWIKFQHEQINKNDKTKSLTTETSCFSFCLLALSQRLGCFDKEPLLSLYLPATGPRFYMEDQHVSYVISVLGSQMGLGKILCPNVLKTSEILFSEQMRQEMRVSEHQFLIYDLFSHVFSNAQSKSRHVAFNLTEK